MIHAQIQESFTGISCYAHPQAAGPEKIMMKHRDMSPLQKHNFLNYTLQHQFLAGIPEYLKSLSTDLYLAGLTLKQESVRTVVNHSGIIFQLYLMISANLKIRISCSRILWYLKSIHSGF